MPAGIFKGKYEWSGEVDKGDCSLLVRDAEVEFDSGAWQCSVTASSFRAKDALVSKVSQLVVREPPTEVLIKHSDYRFQPHHGVISTADDNHTIDVLENTNITLECSSIGGNPPPQLSWHLPESMPSFSLSESSVNGSAVSVISALVIRSDSGKTVKCKARHHALSRPLEKSVQINVLCKYM